MFIFEDSILLSCFVNGNRLFFRSSPNSANIIHTVDLARDPYISARDLTEILERGEHLPVFRIRHKKTGLFLVGFNYMYTEEGETGDRYPVFAKHKPFVYINHNKAEELALEFVGKQYDVEVI
jgi:hypothetical protein